MPQTRPLKISPRGKAPKLLCDISVLYTSLHFQGVRFSFACYDETTLLNGINTNEGKPNDSEQDLQTSYE